ncbi:MAG: D-alanine--D-alanine ligase [Candidatus Moranbacteria bacterium]|nr:D-alanine--D-alanine ligase [Candidatus Moranbacteria bacterium]
MKNYKKIRVGVFCGGSSSERKISLLTGEQVAKALVSKGYIVYIICIESDGRWIISLDKKSNKKEIVVEKINEYIDVAFLALHGKYGEDGTIQKLLDEHNIIYTGSGPEASALGMNKEECSRKISLYGIHTPKTIIYEKTLETVKKKIYDSIGFPCIIKPNASGSSVGITLVKEESELETSMREAQKEGEKILIQEYIRGREFSCGVLGNREFEKFALPVVEICPKNHEFFDYEAKYQKGETDEICPAKIEESISNEIQCLAKKVHELLGCDGLTRSDFIVDSLGNIFFLEINTIPGQTQTSLCPKEAFALGWSFSDFIIKQIELAFKK